VERLTNGNTTIVNCHAGPSFPQMLEVTPEKEVVWTFKDFVHFGNAMPVGRVLGEEPPAEEIEVPGTGPAEDPAEVPREEGFGPREEEGVELDVLQEGGR